MQFFGWPLLAVDFGKELTPQTDVMLYHLVIVSECCEAAFSQYDLANAHGALTMVPVYGWAKSVVRFLRPGSSNSESEVSLTAFFFWNSGMLSGVSLQLWAWGQAGNSLTGTSWVPDSFRQWHVVEGSQNMLRTYVESFGGFWGSESFEGFRSCWEGSGTIWLGVTPAALIRISAKGVPFTEQQTRSI